MISLNSDELRKVILTLPALLCLSIDVNIVCLNLPIKSRFQHSTRPLTDVVTHLLLTFLKLCFSVVLPFTLLRNVVVRYYVNGEASST